MKNEMIKYKLAVHGLRVWQLCRKLGISRQKYYDYSHENFKGHLKQIKSGIKSLIKSKGDANDDD